MQEWSQEEIDNFIQEGRTGLLYLFTPLCGTCQVAGKMLAVIEELVSEKPIGKTDLNFIPNLAEQLGIESVPCLIIIKDGHVQDKIYAFHSVPYLLDKIKSTM